MSMLEQTDEYLNIALFESNLAAWNIEQTERAILEANSGEFATALELQTVLSKYDNRTVKP